MLRPENTHPNDQDAILRDADLLESTENAGFGRVSDSATSADDAGLPDLGDDANDDDGGALELTMTDALSGGDRPELHSPEDSSYDAPGGVDMEELDDFTIEEALPPDARLDPLEP